MLWGALAVVEFVPDQCHSRPAPVVSARLSTLVHCVWPISPRTLATTLFLPVVTESQIPVYCSAFLLILGVDNGGLGGENHPLSAVKDRTGAVFPKAVAQKAGLKICII